MRRFIFVALMSGLALAFGPCGGDDQGDPGLPPQSTGEPAASETSVPVDDGVAVIAINANGLEEFPAAVFWTGESGDAPTLPAGYWYVVVFEDDVRRMSDAVESSGTSPIELDGTQETIPGDDGEAIAAFETLAHYLLTYHEAYLSSLDVLSGGFETLMFDPDATVDPESAARLRLVVGELEASAPQAGTAADVLGRARLVSANAGPSAGLFDYLKGKIEDPIKAQASAERARRELELAFGRMTLEQQRAAFAALKQERGLEIEATDPATFIEQLATGDYDNLASQARNYLQNHEDYFDYFDLRNIQTARDEGAKLVTEGAQYYAQALKKVLVKKFPGLEQGWDAVTKLEEKLQRLQHPEINPEDVQALLKQLGYDVSQEEAESIVQLAQYSYELLVSKLSNPAASPTPRRTDLEGGWGVYDMAPIEKVRNSKLGILVAEVGKVNNIKICSMSGGGLCDGENANTTLDKAGGVVLVLGPFASEEEAVQAFCDGIVPGTVRYSQFWGQLADMKYDGQLHNIDNAPACE